MDEEQAINSIGKDIYIADYINIVISKTKVKSVVEVSNNKQYQFQAVTAEGEVMVNPIFTFDEAYHRLVDHFERKMTVACDDLNKALLIEEF